MPCTALSFKRRTTSSTSACVAVQGNVNSRCVTKIPSAAACFNCAARYNWEVGVSNDTMASRGRTAPKPRISAAGCAFIRSAMARPSKTVERPDGPMLRTRRARPLEPATELLGVGRVIEPRDIGQDQGPAGFAGRQRQRHGAQKIRLQSRLHAALGRPALRLHLLGALEDA